jgi:hypothetical protein
VIISTMGTRWLPIYSLDDAKDVINKDGAIKRTLTKPVKKRTYPAVKGAAPRNGDGVAAADNTTVTPVTPSKKYRIPPSP